MWKEAALTCFKELSRNLPVGTENNHDLGQVSITAEIRTGHLLNIGPRHFLGSGNA
jgi:hypothetical protein